MTAKCPCCGQDMPDQIKINYVAVLEDMNRILGTKYRFTAKFKELVSARAKEGFKVEDFAQVCRNMKAAWGNDPKMAEFLRPVTLFGTKFDSYLNRVQPEASKVNNGLPQGLVW